MEKDAPATGVGLASGDVPDAGLASLLADWFWESDDQHRFTRVRRVSDRALPFSLEAHLGKTRWEMGALNMQEADWAAHRATLDAHQPFRHFELQRLNSSGTVYWSQISGRPLWGADGHFLGYRGVGVDVTAQRDAEEALRETRAELSATLSALPDFMFEVDLEGRYHKVHAPQSTFSVAPPQGLVGRLAQDVLPPHVLEVDRRAMAEAYAQGASRGHVYAADVAGQRRWFELSMARKVMAKGQLARFVALVRDITALKQAENELHGLAFFDALTGLPNRRLLLDRIDQVCALMGRTGRYAALMFIDLDGFKAVNDQHGHAGGDAVLEQIATRLLAQVRDSDSVGRLSGDEFLVLLPVLGDNAQEAGSGVERVAHQTLDAMRQPFEVPGGAKVELSASIGVVLFQGAHSAQALLQRADRLMYQAKTAGKDRWSLEHASPVASDRAGHD